MNPQEKKPPQPKKEKGKAGPVKVNLADVTPPEYWPKRVAIWDELRAAQAEAFKAKEKPIKVTLPDGSQKDAIAFKSTPMDIANEISKGLAQSVVVAKVDGVLYDTFRPLEADCQLQLLKYDDPEAKKVFWHSSSHILGQCLERKYHCDLCIGPAIGADKGGGFYYDMQPADPNVSFGEDDYEYVNGMFSAIANEQQPFERLVLPKEKALEMFSYNKYKVQLINEKVPDGESCTAYRCGSLIDLCKGPHLPHTGKVKAFGVWKNSSAYWKGNAENDNLQRVYGMSFPTANDFKAWKVEQDIMKERDHRVQGKKQELFFFHPLSPGCCFFLPKGAKIYNKLRAFIENQYRIRGYTEVITPNMFNKELWEKSGHWSNYKEDMFTLEVEKQQFALKPMNCPGHCLMFAHKSRSYKELPLRFADFGVLHRNELSGALSGLTRVRRFCQDDAHIFCRNDQIQDEIRGALDFLQFVYGTFGFTFKLELSTRPAKALGEVEVWNRAEAALTAELDKFAGPGQWKLNPGDGAFYGPKIDIHVFDVYKREHQCATIQLDFQLPIRFELDFVGDDGKSSVGDEANRPVIIHRAILGSIERFMAILVENTNGKWPFWLSPNPIIIVPVGPKYYEYAAKVKAEVFAAGLDVEVDDGPHSFNKKIAESRNLGANFILVVGENEEKDGTVTVRQRDVEKQHQQSVKDFIASCQVLLKEYK